MQQRRRVAAALAAVLVALVAAAPAQGARTAQVTVMTRNLYLGADLIPAAAAKDQQQLRDAATAIVDHVQATDFPARAKLLAAEVAKARPDLLALQEVATWRTGRGGAPAQTVVYDWLALLRHQLARRHLRYRLVAAQPEFDFQVPTNSGYDARLTLRNAVLAGPRVKNVSSRSAQFKRFLPIHTQVGSANIRRGYDAVTASVGGVRFRLVNTHLEAYSPQIRTDQAKELVAGPLKSRLPVILAGDLNSDRAAAQPDDRLAFQALVDAGFGDRASRRPSCCHDDKTLRANDRFDHIVDHIMSRPRLSVVRTSVTGDGPRTPQGLWPSDHGGLIATLRVRS
jgi:endonuclease/exonuclease/phosphatase family metal-dependent hydrolase